MADPAENVIYAPVTAVTVFRDGALVVRTGRLTVKAGVTRAVMSGLPGSADTESVRIGLRGHDVVLIDVEVDRRYGADPLRDDVARLRGEAEACHDAVQALDDEDAAAAASLAFVGTFLNPRLARWPGR